MLSESNTVIDYKKIFLDDIRLYTTSDDINELKRIGTIIGNYVDVKTSGYSGNSLIRGSRIMEIVYIGSKFSKKEKYEKAIISANAMFDDDKFINILMSNNKFSFGDLCTYLKILKFLQNKFYKDTISDSDMRYIKIVDNYSKLLLNHFNKFVGPVSINIIINKLNEIILLKSDELLSKDIKTKEHLH